MNKHRFNFALPIISAIALPISSIAYSANPPSAIDILNDKLQKINKLQDELNKQLEELRTKQSEIGQQRKQLEEQLTAQQRQAEAREAKLSTQVQELQQNVEEFKSEQGVIEMKAVNTRLLTDTSKCEPGSDNERGERNGRVNFTKKFSVAPNVHAALKQIDMNGSSDRLIFNVLSVDSQGFNYSFNTWCDTAIYSAVASWIAVTP